MLGGDSINVNKAGLPNITGKKYFGSVSVSANGSYEGCIQTSATGSGYTWRDGPYYGADWTFDASLSNPIYGSSDTVTPASFTLLPQIKF